MSTQVPYVRAFKTRAGTGTVGPWIPTIAGATMYDPNNLLLGVDQVHNGIRVTLRNSAGTRDLPPTMGVLSIPGIIDVEGKYYSSFSLPRNILRWRLIERTVPTVLPSLARVGICFGNNASPALASSGIGVGIDYPSTTLRRTYVTRAVTSVWTNTNATTGQTNCFGVDGTYVPFAPEATDELSSLPLDSTGGLGIIGSNSARFATQMTTLPLMTHTYLCFGWTSAGGAVHSFTIEPRIYYMAVG